MIVGRSLGLRLLAFGAGLIGMALVAAWLVLGLLFERHLERQFRADLERHGLSLIAAVSLTPDGRPQLKTQPFDPRFDRPAGGLYWRIAAPGGVIASRSLWDGVLPETSPPPARGWGSDIGRGPFEPQIVTVMRDIQLDPGGPQILVQVAGDRAPIQQARTMFGFETGVFLAVLWIVLAIAAWIQVRLGLAPLEQVRKEVAALERHPGARLSDERGPTEIGPLTIALNGLLDARAADLERARQRARDLAHALKTPLTALRLQVDALPTHNRSELADTVSVVTATVEGELARAMDSGAPSLTPMAQVIDRVWAVIARTPEGSRLAFRNDVPASLELPMSEETALETLGALLENAARFANSQVVVSGTDQDYIALTIDDDGPGIAADMRDEALQRGRRLDERGGRHGLGLAIAADRIEMSSGRLELGRSPKNGLRVSLIFKHATDYARNQ